MGDDRKADYEMAPTEDPENPATPPEKTELQVDDNSSDQEWSGLGKEELLRVADTPAWNWTRNILLVLFWIAWILMLIVAIVLVVKAPSCPKVEWYEKSSIYQVFVPSFKDGNSDGTGDLIGLKEQVAAIKENFGAETILLSPIYKQASGGSSNYLGRETVDFKDVDAVFGTLGDFDKIIQAVQVNGMHIVIEFVPNQSSDKHPWFEESKKSKNATDNEYADYYTWADGQGSDPPNDWTNYNGDTAWTYVADRDQWYYHFYESTSPDLNFKNDKVVKEIQDAMTFWLDEMNVDGFVLVDADRLVEGPVNTAAAGRKRRQVAPDLAATDAPMDIATSLPMTDPTTEQTPEPTPEPTPEHMGASGQGGDQTDTGGDPMHSSSDHAQYGNLGGDSTLSDDLAKLLEDLYSILDANSYLGKYRVFIPQHSGPLEQNVFFQREGWRGYASSLSFANSLGESVTSYDLYEQLHALQEAKAASEKSDLWNSWMLGHAGGRRFASRTGVNARALMMLLYTLPGTPLPFYGDELGLKDNAGGAFPQLMPYPWDGSATGGFGNASAEPWAPYADNLAEVNAETQLEDKGSFLNYYKILTGFHEEPSILAGAVNLTSMSDDVLAYTRAYPEWPEYLVVVNLAGSAQPGIHAYETDMKGEIKLSASGKKIGDEVQPESVDIGPNDAYLIELMNK